MIGVSWYFVYVRSPSPHFAPDHSLSPSGRSGLRLRAEGLLAICIDARHAKAALGMAANKTDANDADGLAHLAEAGFFREVRVKGFDSMLTGTLVAARTRPVLITTELSNQIRAIMKTFGLALPAGKGTTFEKNARRLLM